ncbi:PAC2 family protein [Corynebacterium epidermidicanis]|uniref:ATP-grasp superfamily enzyme n=1 Tax=Corynebacterium epidermidicanis TaxID=1050174 RepID=A0A0G3GRY4_9CORY|nr:PAC2 family protein [Corynebacterium epidermidicanis]AKK03320.1 ATP-grasp superfamily enzyme [Corynebacterium epidermidicanis]
MADHKPSMYELEYPAPEVSTPENSGPTLIIALHGYADAGQAVEAGAKHLRAALDHRTLASFNSDELIDYRSRRPVVTIDHNEVVRSDDLNLGLDVIRDSQGKSFLLLSGPEPDLRWEAFSRSVSELADRFNVDKTVCLYAAPMAVPHTRPLVITAHGSNPETTSNFFKMDTKITIPGSASLQIERMLTKKGRDVSGLTAHVPHYLSASDYPEATWQLLNAAASIAELDLPLRSLQADAERVMGLVQEQVAESQEIQAVVHALESQYDEELARYQQEHPQQLLPGVTDVPSGEELGQEFEKFLAELEQGEDPYHGDNGSGPNAEEDTP